jgi:hypothetical protein
MGVNTWWRTGSGSRRWPRPRSGRRWIPGVLLALWLSGLLAGMVLADGPPVIRPQVIGGAGGHHLAGVYSLGSTIGQPLVGRTSAADWSLCSGFRCAAVEMAAYELFLPLVLRDGA